jgi:hypothetical protein
VRRREKSWLHEPDIVDVLQKPGMRRRTTAAIIMLVVAGATIAFIPVIPGHSASCDSNAACVPEQKLSITENYLGFGAESSYNGTFYHICGLSDLSGLTRIPAC